MRRSAESQSRPSNLFGAAIPALDPVQPWDGCRARLALVTREPARMEECMDKGPSARAAWGMIAVMLVGYMGVYLCRTNLSVAVPMLQEARWNRD